MRSDKEIADEIKCVRAQYYATKDYREQIRCKNRIFDLFRELNEKKEDMK